MDTSDFDTARQVLGRSSIPFKQISPAAWLEIVEDIYRDSRIHDVPDLFEKFADLTGGNHTFVEVCVPHGKTFFEKGIGVNTLVHLVPLKEENLGEMLATNSPRLTEFRKQSFLLLIKPEEHKPLRWAFWSLSATRSAVQKKSGTEYKQTVTVSSVHFLNEKGVLQVFEKEPYAARYLCRISSNVVVYAEVLKDRAHRLARFGEWLTSINDRVYVPS